MDQNPKKSTKAFHFYAKWSDKGQIRVWHQIQVSWQHLHQVQPMVQNMTQKIKIKVDVSKMQLIEERSRRRERCETLNLEKVKGNIQAMSRQISESNLIRTILQTLMLRRLLIRASRLPRRSHTIQSQINTTHLQSHSCSHYPKSNLQCFRISNSRAQVRKIHFSCLINCCNPYASCKKNYSKRASFGWFKNKMWLRKPHKMI